MKKNIFTYSAFVAVAVFGLLGWSLALTGGQSAAAQGDGEKVDSELLESLYDAVFHRPSDSDGRRFHLGRSIRDVLRDFRNAPEQRYYGALFKAVKSYEEAQRAPGNLTEEEKQSHLDLIDSALSNLLAWVGTLPDKNPCEAVISSEEAREAIKEAYDRLDNEGKDHAKFGLLNALRRLGAPDSIRVYRRCVSPSPSPTATASPTASPTPTATVSPTPTQ